MFGKKNCKFIILNILSIIITTAVSCFFYEQTTILLFIIFYYPLKIVLFNKKKELFKIHLIYDIAINSIIIFLTTLNISISLKSSVLFFILSGYVIMKYNKSKLVNGIMSIYVILFISLLANTTEDVIIGLICIIANSVLCLITHIYNKKNATISY